MDNKNILWIGGKIKIKDLSSSHLINIINYLKKKNRTEINGVKLKTLNQELRLRKLNSIENNNIENNPD